MRRRIRVLLDHPVVRTLLFERLLITGAATLAVAAVAMGHVRLREIPGLLDVRLLALFFVLTVAVELGKIQTSSTCSSRRPRAARAAPGRSPRRCSSSPRCSLTQGRA